MKGCPCSVLIREVGPGLAPAAAVSTFFLRSSGLPRPTLSPLGERVDRRRRSLQPVSRRGRVRGWWACPPPFAVHTAPLKALGNDHATSSALSRNPGTAVRCLWFQGIDPPHPPAWPPQGAALRSNWDTTVVHGQSSVLRSMELKIGARKLEITLAPLVFLKQCNVAYNRGSAN